MRFLATCLFYISTTEYHRKQICRIHSLVSLVLLIHESIHHAHIQVAFPLTTFHLLPFLALQL